MKTAVHGFVTRTITIPTGNDQFQYNLGDYQQDNFGENAIIFAMSLRVDTGSGNVRSKGDRPLIGTALAKEGYLNLVQDGKDRKGVIYQGNLYTLTREDNNSYDLFFEPCKLNWDESIIAFDSDATIDGTQDIELTIYYIFNESGKGVETNILFDNGFSYLGLKKYNLEVVTKSDSRIFQLNNGRNPLGACALLVGMRINNFAGTTPKGNDIITSDAYLDSSFLTMKFGQNSSVLDMFPLGILEPFKYLGYAFFPIMPILSTDYDWSNCQIEVSDKDLPGNDDAYLITFFYIDVNIEEWRATNK